MAELSEEQIRFLRSQNIPLSYMFDASGMRSSEWMSAMKPDGKYFAYGVSACQKAGHTLRTRHNHCIQCDTSKIAYMLRSDATAFVYVAGSHERRLIKIGSSIDVNDRLKKLNEYCYGGAGDWQILASAHCKSAGKVESQAQGRLANFHQPGEYIRAGKRQKCYELLKCDFIDARNAVNLFLGNATTLKVPNPERAEQSFAFRQI